MCVCVCITCPSSFVGVVLYGHLKQVHTIYRYIYLFISIDRSIYITWPAYPWRTINTSIYVCIYLSIYKTWPASAWRTIGTSIYVCIHLLIYKTWPASAWRTIDTSIHICIYLSIDLELYNVVGVCVANYRYIYFFISIGRSIYITWPAY